MPRAADYDTIAHLYDEPLRDHRVDPDLQAFAAQHGARTAAPLVVADLGCGTGKWLAANRTACTPCRVIGLDLSRGMLQVARRRLPDVPLVHGSWSHLPFAAQSIDFLRSTFSYHFVDDKPAMLREAHRALRPLGRLVVTDIDPWSMEGWPIYRFFPEARALDDCDFVPAEQIAALMREAGFSEIAVTREPAPSTQDLREFLAFAEQRHRASQMRAIPDAAYQRGLGTIREAIRDAQARTPPELPLIEAEFCLILFAGTRSR